MSSGKEVGAGGGEEGMEYLGYHGGGGTEAQHLLDHLSGVDHLIQDLSSDRSIQVRPQPPLLLPHLSSTASVVSWHKIPCGKLRQQ